MESRVVLVGLVGAAASTLDALIEDGSLPFLNEWIPSTARAGLRFSTPVSNVAAWTSLITGRSPAQHGVFDLFRKQSPSGHQLRALTSRDLACEALWTGLDRECRRTTVVDYPLTLPPPRIEGHVLPGSWSAPRQMRFGCHPSDLFRRLGELGIVQMEAFAWDSPGERDTSSPAGRSGWVQAQIERERHFFRTIKFLMENEPSDLTVFLVRAFGTVQSWYERFPEGRPACVEYFRALDAHLTAVVKAAGPQATVVLLSEPNVGASKATLFLNAWLAGRGDLAWAGGQGPLTLEPKVLDTGELTRQAGWIDWNATRAFSPLAGGSEIYIVRKDGQHSGGIVDAEYELFRDRLAAELQTLSGVSRVWRREQLYNGPNQDVAPDLVVETLRGVSVSPLASDAPLISVGEAGTARPAEGLFRAGGPGIRPGATLPAMSILDVAPLVWHLLDLSIPGDLEGRLPVEVLDPAWYAARPARRGAGEAQRAPEKPVLDPQAEDEILQRLRSLGYLE